MKRAIILAAIVAAAAGGVASAQELCVGYGPQTPRDISSLSGANERLFTLAPSSSQMNLCNIHTHTNAEHRGPGFAIYAGDGPDGGYKCAGSDDLTDAELTDPAGDAGAYKGVKPGDTIEVHWVFSSCDVAPGEGLGACLSDACANPQLRVEAQVFLVVNDPEAADFAEFAYAGPPTGDYHQPKALPFGGEPVVFAGSTTGPSYSQAACSPLQVTWSVRPTCQRVDISSLHAWAEANPFNETKSHGVRALVTAPELLSPIN